MLAAGDFFFTIWVVKQNLQGGMRAAGEFFLGVFSPPQAKKNGKIAKNPGIQIWLIVPKYLTPPLFSRRFGRKGGGQVLGSLLILFFWANWMLVGKFWKIENQFSKFQNLGLCLAICQTQIQSSSAGLVIIPLTRRGVGVLGREKQIWLRKKLFQKIN